MLCFCYNWLQRKEGAARQRRFPVIYVNKSRAIATVMKPAKMDARRSEPALTSRFSRASLELQ